ncbi:TetR family transcriptional regulator [Streptomyces sp. Y1]|uniref:TetR family transcriptional regulator n=1 Tax=Streptomyces sp. Y1 TaxID=3238634 RepID=A0AB39TWW8_9ACTN
MDQVRQEKARRTRGRLLEAGAELFDRSGYAGATLGEIAAAAGVTKGALYFHFTSKEELAGAVFAQAERSLRAACGSRRTATSPLQALIDAGHWLADALGSDPLIRAAFRLGREGDWQCTGGSGPGSGAGPGSDSGAGPGSGPAPGSGPGSTDPHGFHDFHGFHAVWAGITGDLLAAARRAGELRGRPDAPGPGPDTLVVTAACGLEVVLADGCPPEERARRVGALWDWLLPCLVPPGAVGAYRTGPPALGPA